MNRAQILNQRDELSDETNSSSFPDPGHIRPWILSKFQFNSLETVEPIGVEYHLGTC